MQKVYIGSAKLSTNLININQINMQTRVVTAQIVI